MTTSTTIAPRTMKTYLIVAAALALVTGTAAGQERVDERLRTSATGNVVIVNTSGSVRVTAWDRQEIQVTGTLGRGTERLSIQENGDRTEIRVVLPRRSERNIRGSDLQIRLPARKHLVVETVSADISVRGVEGIIEAKSVSGDVVVNGSPRGLYLSTTSGDLDVNASSGSAIELKTVSGDLEIRGAARSGVGAETVSGNIDVDVTTPELRAKTVSGDLALRGAGESVDVTTVSGTTRVDAGTLRRGNFESVSGDIELTSSLANGAVISLSSHSGDIGIALPASASADVELRTFSGDFHNGWGSQVADRRRRPGESRELRFSTGRGGGRVSVKTFSGDIFLRQR